MRESRGLLILLAVVVVVAGVVWFATRQPPESTVPSSDDEGPLRFHYTDALMNSPDLEVVLHDVRGAVYAGHTSWLVNVGCAEIGGCAGEFAVEVEFLTGDGSRQLVLAGRFDVADGGIMAFEGLQNPSTGINKIDRVTLEVRHRAPAGGLETEVED